MGSRSWRSGSTSAPAEGSRTEAATLSFRRRPNPLGRDRVVVVRQVYREGWRGPNQVGKVTVRPEAVPVLSVEEASFETVAPFVTELYRRFSGDWGVHDLRGGLTATDKTGQAAVERERPAADLLPQSPGG